MIAPRPVFVQLAGRKRLSQGGLFEIKPQVNAPVSISLGLGSLPLSIGLFAASGASFLIGSQVKSIKPVTDIIGVAAAGFGVLNLVMGGPKEAGPTPPPATREYGADAPPRFSEEQQIPIAPPRELSEILSVQLDPYQNGTGGDTRNNWQDQEFEFTARNNDSVTRSFCAGLAVYDSSMDLVYRAPSSGGRECFSVGAYEVITGRLTAPAFKFWTPQVVTVAVELFRNKFDEAPFMITDAIGIKVGYVG